MYTVWLLRNVEEMCDTCAFGITCIYLNVANLQIHDGAEGDMMSWNSRQSNYPFCLVWRFGGQLIQWILCSYFVWISKDNNEFPFIKRYIQKMIIPSSRFGYRVVISQDHVCVRINVAKSTNCKFRKYNLRSKKVVYKLRKKSRNPNIPILKGKWDIP